MREIKFRAWDAFYNSFLYSKENNLNGFFHAVEQRKAGEVFVMQYTGLKDKKGVAIYERDVVRVHGDAFDKGDEPEFEVKWDKEGGYFMNDDFGGDYRSCLGDDNYELEVIGNIYENPELLK